MIVTLLNNSEIEVALLESGICNRVLWKIKMLNGINRLIQENPLRYRSYGPFWWSIKQMLISNGFDLDCGALEKNYYAYQEDDYNLAAGVLLAIEWSENYFGTNEFDLVIGAETHHYVLEDSGMERKGLAMSLNNTFSGEL